MKSIAKLLPVFLAALLFTSCYKDDLKDIKDSLDDVDARLAQLEAVNQQIGTINSTLSSLQQGQSDLANNQSQLAKLQVLMNQVTVLSKNPGTDLNELSTLLETVNANINENKIDESIALVQDFLDNVDYNTVQLGNKSISPQGQHMFDLKSGFEGISIYTLLTSEDVLPMSPDFVYGSMADGNGLMRNGDGSFSLINNIEADYSIARITFDPTFTPIRGEYILNATATANTAMCSGTLVTPEEHGFGPIYLSGGEWGDGIKQGVYATDPSKKPVYRDQARVLTSLGEWAVENAVVMHKDAYPDKTVVMIGDDHSDNNIPQGQFGLYVGNRGDLDGGKLYGLKVTTEGVEYEMDMKENMEYAFEMVELEEKEIDLLNQEAMDKGVMGFSRVEDIDYRKGAANVREVYFAVTGRKKSSLEGKGTFYGRIYKLNFDENSPLSGTISPVLDGDILDGKAKAFHSPDNVLATENFLYIQEDPNGYPDTADKSHYAQLYQYNLNTGELKTVLECDQASASALGYGNTTTDWEITGMTDISDVIGVPNTFLLITQNHGWEPLDGSAFTDPQAIVDFKNSSSKEGSMLFVIHGLER
ncbi:phosphatase [Marinilongibacter aquaticus]|uniref:phosphatase n=1 Tax=Marinilongibacter aquaticus TaxID=2975157 RepID=UPI0021BDAE86|nr:phosphatase [Marinilongibacter aquaticus]UBM59088.1 phosphatase [Marinilongibacter aquaticus]